MPRQSPEVEAAHGDSGMTNRPTPPRFACTSLTQDGLVSG